MGITCVRCTVSRHKLKCRLWPGQNKHTSRRVANAAAEIDGVHDNNHTGFICAHERARAPEQ